MRLATDSELRGRRDARPSLPATTGLAPPGAPETPRISSGADIHLRRKHQAQTEHAVVVDVPRDGVSGGAAEKTISDADFMAKVKANSTSWVKSNFEGAKSFAWQEGYGWFSVSRSNVDRVSAYIDGQKEHHRTATSKEEFLAFLERHEVEYDKRFIWE